MKIFDELIPSDGSVFVQWRSSLFQCIKCKGECKVLGKICIARQAGHVRARAHTLIEVPTSQMVNRSVNPPTGPETKQPSDI